MIISVVQMCTHSKFPDLRYTHVVITAYSTHSNNFVTPCSYTKECSFKIDYCSIVVALEPCLQNTQDVEHSCTIETEHTNELGVVRYKVFVSDKSGQCH